MTLQALSALNQPLQAPEDELDDSGDLIDEELEDSI